MRLNCHLSPHPNLIHPISDVNRNKIISQPQNLSRTGIIHHCCNLRNCDVIGSDVHRYIIPICHRHYQNRFGNARDFYVAVWECRFKTITGGIMIAIWLIAMSVVSFMCICNLYRILVLLFLLSTLSMDKFIINSHSHPSWISLVTNWRRQFGWSFSFCDRKQVCVPKNKTTSSWFIYLSTKSSIPHMTRTKQTFTVIGKTKNQQRIEFPSITDKAGNFPRLPAKQQICEHFMAKKNSWVRSYNINKIKTVAPAGPGRNERQNSISAVIRYIRLFGSVDNLWEELVLSGTLFDIEYRGSIFNFGFYRAVALVAIRLQYHKLN